MDNNVKKAAMIDTHRESYQPANRALRITQRIHETLGAYAKANGYRRVNDALADLLAQAEKGRKQT